MADKVVSKGIKNIKYSFIAQTLILLIGVLKSLIIPNVLTVESYAHWQIYLFYIGYVGFFYLGYNDGILLKYGSYDYKSLPFEKLRSSLRYYILMLAVSAAALFTYAINIQQAEKSFIMMIMSVSIPIYGLYGVFIYVFLITNQIKKHSIFTAVDSVSNLIGIVFLIIIRQQDFHYIIWFVSACKLISVIIMCIMCKDFFIGKRASMKDGFFEFIDNVKVGFFLMTAQIASMLVTGVGKLIIEYSGQVDNYAYYSFGMTIINIVMVAVVAVSTVMYPTLGRVAKDKLPSYFKTMYKYLTHFNVLSLALFFPAYLFVSIFFKKYNSMLNYFAILFSIMAWQSKLNIINNSFYKVLRLEKKMLVVNLIGLAFFGVVSVSIYFTIGTHVENKIFLVACFSLATMIFNELLAEKILRNKLKVKFDNQLWINILINILFLITAYIRNIFIGALFYCFFIIVYFIIFRKDLTDTIKFTIGMLRKKNPHNNQ